MEQQWNEGQPPAGEVGMCVCHSSYDGGLIFKKWSGEYFSEGYYIDAMRFPNSARDAWGNTSYDHALQPKDWRWATLADPGVTAEMLHSSQRAAPKQDAPWLPPQQDGFGTWVEYVRGSGVPAVVGNVSTLLAHEREDRSYCHNSGSHADDWDWEKSDGGAIVAYCVALEPAQVQGETVQSRREKITILESPASIKPMIWHAIDANEPMKERDALEKAITTPAKDEGWREYDPKYPPIQPYPMVFKTVGEDEKKRHYYRRTDTPDIELPTWLCVAPFGQRVGSGFWGARS